MAQILIKLEPKIFRKLESTLDKEEIKKGEDSISIIFIDFTQFNNFFLHFLDSRKEERHLAFLNIKFIDFDNKSCEKLIKQSCYELIEYLLKQIYFPMDKSNIIHIMLTSHDKSMWCKFINNKSSDQLFNIIRLVFTEKDIINDNYYEQFHDLLNTVEKNIEEKKEFDHEQFLSDTIYAFVVYNNYKMLVTFCKFIKKHKINGVFYKIKVHIVSTILINQLKYAKMLVKLYQVLNKKPGEENDRDTEKEIEGIFMCDLSNFRYIKIKSLQYLCRIWPIIEIEDHYIAGYMHYLIENYHKKDSLESFEIVAAHFPNECYDRLNSNFIEIQPKYIKILQKYASNHKRYH